MNRLNIEQKIDRIISCNKDKRSLYFHCNGKIFCKINLDDKQNSRIINNNSLRCDYIIVSEELKDIALWIELKGSNIAHALEQIEQSIKNFGKNITNKYVAVVCSKSYPKFNTEKQKFSKKHKLDGLFIKSIQLNLEYNATTQTIEQ